MSPNAQPPDPFEALLAQLSEFFCPTIVAGYMDHITLWHREGRALLWMVKTMTSDLHEVCPTMDMLEG